MEGLQNCPICWRGFLTLVSTSLGDWYSVPCPRCGNFEITGSAKAICDQSTGKQSIIVRSARSHWVSTITSRLGDWKLRISSDLFKRISDEAHIRNPSWQLDHLVLLLGAQEDPSESFMIAIESLLSICGARIEMNSYHTLIQNAMERSLIHRSGASLGSGSLEAGVAVSLQLTLTGWERYEQLQNSVVNSKNAFMAMKFGEAQTDRAYRECFKLAAADAGFELSINTELQAAGLIDDQMRVAIRSARFIVSDLSDGNQGAYWEAGFAEGLGKPVIYACRKDVWENADTKPHFDTNHMATIVWDPADLETARKQLTATIRNTFPGEARMSDG